MVHLCDDMGIDKKIHNRESHRAFPFKVAWKGAGITPFFKELIIMVDPFLDLDEVSSPFHLTKELPFVEFEGFILFEIGAVLNRSNSKTQVGESATIIIRDGKRDFSLHGHFLFWDGEASQSVDLPHARFGVP